MTRTRYGRSVRLVGRVGRGEEMRMLMRSAALLATLALVWVCAPGALAGGPTSVLITSPESAETASLLYVDQAYTRLMKEVGAGGGTAASPTGTKKRPSSLDGVRGLRQINVVWMAHDVSPWRVDRVFASPDPSLIWIRTESRFAEPDSPDSGEGRWHRADDPAALHALLVELGVMGPKVAYDAVAAPSVPPAAGKGRPTAGAVTVDAGGFAWWWAIPALAMGMTMGLAIRPLAARLPRRPFTRNDIRDDGPRRRLLDV
ncbi:hypothetical protein ACIO1C_19180 [Streptomyces sp. NPDC087420]|uniref:hypothetical protein n=1 Tax=Streptomyces sp. NPDC087420 TaxID=3365785 RepID=UPI003838F883